MLEPISFDFKKKPILILAGFVFAYVNLMLVVTALGYHLGPFHLNGFSDHDLSNMHGARGPDWLIQDKGPRFFFGLFLMTASILYTVRRIKIWRSTTPQFYADENGITAILSDNWSPKKKYTIEVSWDEIERVSYEKIVPTDPHYVQKKTSGRPLLKIYVPETFGDNLPFKLLHPSPLILEIDHINKRAFRKYFMEDLRKFSDKVELVKD